MAMTRSKDALCLKFALIEGTDSATNVTVTGIKAEDTLIYALLHDSTSGIPTTDLTSVATLGTDTIQFDAAGMNGDSITLLWTDNSA